ncbi:MAG: hypothetical protein LBI62_00945 [Candidatus Accumulibacter sp.]|jgi:hypothetical protein|nr:hypothetical protein [Accumulibacter sp.]
MGVSDFLYGQTAANYANRRAFNEYDQALDQWETYSNKLKGKLSQAEEQLYAKEIDFVRAEAWRHGLARLLERMTAELVRLDPGNSLVREDEQDKIILSAAVTKFAALGFDYDPNKDTFRKSKSG